MHTRSSSRIVRLLSALMMSSSGLAGGISSPSLCCRHDYDAVFRSSRVLSVRISMVRKPTHWTSAHGTTRMDAVATFGEIDGDVDEHESALVFFDVPTAKIRLRGSALDAQLHPIIVLPCRLRTKWRR